MPDGPTAMSAAASYAQIYVEQQPQLVAYARSLTGNPWLAEDLVSEAHFRVWRRLSAGHHIDNVPAYLTTTVRNLAATAGRSTRESPQDPQDVQDPRDAHGPWVAGPAGPMGADHDPGTRIASVELLARVLGQLPERWVKALWLAEAEDQPLEAVARGVGTGRGATAVLLHRAREGMRQAFLRAHPGEPADPACAAYWERMPAHVRDADSARQSEKLQRHLDDCADCRDRLTLLMHANTRLPALAGPALLVLVLGGAGKFLVSGAAVGGAAGAAAVAGGSGPGHGSLHAVRHVLTGGSKLPAVMIGAVAASVAGAAVAGGLILGGTDAPVPPQRTATEQSAAPTPRDEAQDARPEQQPDPVRKPSTDEEPPRAPAGPDERAAASAPAERQPAPAVPPPAVREQPAAGPAREPAAEPTEEPAAAPPPRAEPTPAASKPVEPTPAEPTPAEPTPVEPTPVEPTPVDPTPAEPTPVEPTPAEPTPVEPTPVEPTPVEPTTNGHWPPWPWPFGQHEPHWRQPLPREHARDPVPPPSN